MNNVNPIPEGYHSVTPNLILRNAKQALEYYKKAFGAEVTFQHDRPDGKLAHATIRIGDSILMLGEECAPHERHEDECARSPADLKGTTVNLYLYVENVDDVFKRAVESGGEEMMTPTDMFWGDRVGMLKDPFGHFWTVATQKEYVGPEELQKRSEEFFHQHAGV